MSSRDRNCRKAPPVSPQLAEGPSGAGQGAQGPPHLLLLVREGGVGIAAVGVQGSGELLPPREKRAQDPWNGGRRSLQPCCGPSRWENPKKTHHWGFPSCSCQCESPKELAAHSEGIFLLEKAPSGSFGLLNPHEPEGKPSLVVCVIPVMAFPSLGCTSQGRDGSGDGPGSGQHQDRHRAGILQDSSPLGRENPTHFLLEM